ncbi:hypothetical protein HYC85_028511 [Camellia sinensis]|uniref:Uncharacterized protein n=1 Tax=Camellia sinensis TaxID=4442 RepID=A0A7J7FVC6_CAMSI|nr:hypothetical protein HYC85_028511 [Camellia sinensis]
MSGQFTESCRTHKGANRNQCRDSLQSLVGPLKSRTLKRCAQSIKRRAIKRRAHFIKRCAGHDGEARGRLGLRARLSAGGKRRAMRVAALAI